MKWEIDYCKIYFKKHYYDQIGLNKNEARHVYAVCPLCALGSCLLVFPSIFVDGTKSFSRKDQKKCFNTCFQKVTH